MSSAPTIEQIARDATWLAQALDPAAGVARLVAMDRDAYRAASFLDDRMMTGKVDAHLLPWAAIAAATAAATSGQAMRSDARWIFHIGHVGSTLVSRLLGELPAVLAVREPRLLRDLALASPHFRDALIGPATRLMSRAFATGELACVKATSFVSEIAPDLVPPGERALFLFATPRNYVASILAGENSIKELRMLAEPRAERMKGRVIALASSGNSDAHRAAAAWACEMTALEQAAEQTGDRRIAWADFDAMLGDMERALGSVADHFGFPTAPGALAAIAAGPLMTRYSKALEYDYSAALRRELIDEAVADHRRDIDSALAMLAAAAEKSPLLARALARAGED